ncbi:MAG: methyltransferase domain-containing protein [Nannocystaceae bacterium]|nr:methyltransferase domain-containing protein [Nannocystaceae bacterium]
MTTRLLQDAGISEGMTVLDVGCGHGNVTRMLADRVGPKGHVVGIDLNERALDRARALCEAGDVRNVTFVCTDLATPPTRDPLYDAVVGRRVLMYVPDRLAALKALAGVLRPGGVAAFHEIDGSMTPSSRVPHPLHDSVNRWLWTTIQREGATTTMGFELPTALEAADLQLAGVWAEAIVEHAKARQPTAQRVRAVLPRIVKHGVATASEVDVDTLDARLEEELRSAGGVHVASVAFCAWATKS